MSSRGFLLSRPLLPTLLAASLVALMVSFSSYFSHAHATPKATEFRLGNGMTVVVVEDHRA